MTTATRINRTPKDMLIISAITLTILAMFPLLALTGLALQLAFVVALPLAVLALLAMPLLSKARASEIVEVQGISLPEGLYLHERHGWARRARRGRYLVGADELLLHAFSAVEQVELPAVGDAVEQGAPLATLRSGDRSITLKAPFAGTVQRVNTAVAEETSLLHGSPYARGWLVELAPAAGVRSLDGLRESSTARPWLTHEIDRMLALLARPDQATVLADGGMLGAGYAATLPTDTWEQLAEEMF